MIIEYCLQAEKFCPKFKQILRRFYKEIVMHESTTVEKKSYRRLIDEVQHIVSLKKGSREEKLGSISELLAENISVFDWVGFYFVDPDAERELVLGPYVGEETDHTRIPFGTGICGQAADSHQTFVVQDVSEADNYLACSIHVKAEIVLPVIKNDAFVVELDIDSHTKDAITKEHQAMLEEICNIVAEIF
jgi:GAF domain-containing protein